VRTLADIVRAAAAPDLSIALVKDRVKVTCGAFAATLGTLPVVDFPLVPDFPHEAGVSLVSSTFAQALDRVRKFIQGDGSTMPHTAPSWASPTGRSSRGHGPPSARARNALAAPVDASAVELLIPRKATEDLWRDARDRQRGRSRRHRA
jgi:hypothetical protein